MIAEKLDVADIGMSLANWFPRNALWVSMTSLKSYFASFQKNF